VCEKLVRDGYSIIARNARLGHLEIDIIARRGALMVFCEVRARRNTRWMTPAQSVDASKVRRIRQAAAIWLKRERPSTSEVRFDVASVVFDGALAEIDYFERAF
jgi:putative endonuclease